MANLHFYTRIKTLALNIHKNNALSEMSDIVAALYPRLLPIILNSKTNETGALRNALYPVAHQQLDAGYSRVLNDHVIQTTRLMHRTGQKIAPPIKGFPVPETNWEISLQGERALLFLSLQHGKTLTLPVLVPKKYWERVQLASGDAWMVQSSRQKRIWFMIARTVIEANDVGESPTEFYGVDYGLVNLAVMAGAEKTVFFDGRPMQKRRRQLARRAEQLREKGYSQKAAELYRRERATMKSDNHLIAKLMIEGLPDKSHAGIALERLSIFKTKTDRETRMARGWDHVQLNRLITYKAVMHRIQIVQVSGAKSSLICPKCQAVQPEPSRRGFFRCTACGFIDNADSAAAQVHRQRGIKRFSNQHGKKGG